MDLQDRCVEAVEATGLLVGDEARDIARAIIPIVMEEAAKMAEEHRAPAGSDYAIACDDVACAIRSRG